LGAFILSHWILRLSRRKTGLLTILLTTGDWRLRTVSMPLDSASVAQKDKPLVASDVFALTLMHSTKLFKKGHLLRNMV